MPKANAYVVAATREICSCVVVCQTGLCGRRCFCEIWVCLGFRGFSVSSLGFLRVSGLGHLLARCIEHRVSGLGLLQARSLGLGSSYCAACQEFGFGSGLRSRFLPCFASGGIVVHTSRHTR